MNKDRRILTSVCRWLLCCKPWRLFVVAAVLCTPVSAVADGRIVQSLDGDWEILFDAENEGREADWHLDSEFSKQASIRRIQVPSCWEEYERDYEGVAFYRRKFQLPADWAGKAIRLQFDAVNYLAEVWLNGEVVGFHEGGFTPFEFSVTSLLQPGTENTLILRVVGPIILQNKRVDGIGPLETPQWRGGITGGIWQSVRLVATGETQVNDVFLIPRIADDSVTFHLELENTGSTSRSVQLVTRIRSAKDPDRTVSKSVRAVSLRPGVSEVTERLEVPDAQYWSPDEPHLYHADVELVGSDSWSSRFGMREFTIRDKQFYLNGKPLYLKATFFEGLYPNRIAYPDSRDMAVREIQLAREAGFNMIRPWRRPPAPMWLDLADEMGVLVVGSPVLECMGLPLSTPYLAARVEREIRESIRRDRNRTCVVQWELFNELHRPILKQMMRPMALLTRELDPTRLILDESGGWAFGARMYLPNEYEPIRFNDIHTYPGPFINKRLYDGFLCIGLTEDEKTASGLEANAPGRNVVPGLMSFVSELGYGSLPNLVDTNQRFQHDGNSLTPAYRYHHRLAEDQRRMLRESGFDDLYPDFEKFCLDQQAIHGAANKRMIEAVRSNPDVAGYCIHALAAGDWILGAGLIDLWRNPKTFAYEATKAANQPRIIAIRMLPRNIYASRGGDLKLSGINDLDELDVTLSVRIVSQSGQTILDKAIDHRWKPGVSNLFEQGLDTKALSGGYTIMASAAAADGTVVTENTYDFDVFAEQDLALPAAQIAVLDLDGPFTRFLEQRGVDVVEFDASTRQSIPVFVTRATANSATEQQRFDELMRFIEAGGTAVYIRGVGQNKLGDDPNQVQSPTVPFAARVEPAQGLWTCIPHLVREHPLFSGLPTGGMMRDVYENVWARQTLRDLDGEPIVASIGFQWFSEDHKLHYSGPGESWWGADLAVVRKGAGRVIVSQLRLVENLGKDPVADRILANLISFAVHP